jgi:hypothetical protein
VPNRLDSLLQRGFANWNDTSPTPQNNGHFRGGNTTMFDGVSFLAEDSSNCPRVALARLWGYEVAKNSNTILSNQVGKCFEETFNTAIFNSGVAGLKLEREEAAQIEVTVGGKVRFTQRPDGIVTDPGSPTPFAIETKSVQSGNTAEAVFHNHKPKLGAVLQLAGVMLYGGLTRGFVVYGLQTYLTHYSYKQKKKLSFTPAIKTFECMLQNDCLTIDGRKTIVTGTKLMAGLSELCAVADGQKELPKVPKWVDTFGDVAKYSGCSFCPWRGPCETMTNNRRETVLDFRTEIETQGANDGENE